MTITLQVRRTEEIVFNQEEVACGDCFVVRKVLTDLVGAKVSEVIMNRVRRELDRATETEALDMNNCLHAIVACNCKTRIA